jgi:hypothetical protein
MTGPESQYELDDELLSAYLDDELSPEDRASVEARLASDSSAAELLHQLRSVSQAVQALPLEQGRDDLREAVMERVTHFGDKSKGAAAAAATQAELRVSPAGTTAAADTSPSFSIGRTRRGWIWASLAIAAALLIMVMQKEPQRDKVAAIDNRKSKSERGRAPSRQLEIRSLNEESEQLATSEPAAPAPSQFTDGSTPASLDVAIAQSEEAPPAPGQPAAGYGTDRLQGGASGAPMGQSTGRQMAQGTRGGNSSGLAPASGPATEVAPTSSMDTLAANEPAAAALAETSDLNAQLGDSLAYRDTVALSEEDSQEAGDKFMVVRVVARRDALEAKEFERLLAQNGVEVVSPADEVVSEDSLTLNARSRRFAVRDQAGLERQTEPEAQQTDSSAVEALLVEAPEATIISCLDSLSKDNVNYLGVAVENVHADDAQIVTNGDFGGRARAKAAPAAAWAWNRYNRGTVPQDKPAPSQDRYLYGNEQRSFGGGGLGGRAEVVEQLDQLKETELSVARKNVGEAKNGRAVRLQTWRVETRDSDAEPARADGTSVPARRTPVPAQRDELERRLSATARTDSDDLQVLFLLQPDESAAPSPRAKARAQ